MVKATVYGVSKKKKEGNPDLISNLWKTNIRITKNNREW